ncbi:MAG: hypothetical protein EOO41_03110, partial [Methanobacteriota archaeon]
MCTARCRTAASHTASSRCRTSSLPFLRSSVVKVARACRSMDSGPPLPRRPDVPTPALADVACTGCTGRPEGVLGPTPAPPPLVGCRANRLLAVSGSGAPPVDA